MSASVVGTFKKLVGSLKFCGIVMEFSRTKSGGRCSFHFTSSEVFHPMPHLPQEAFDYEASGGLQYRFKLLELSNLFGGNLRNWNDIFSNEKWRALLASFH